MTGREQGFEVTRRGYRTAQVDAWVGEVGRIVAELEAERDDARRLAVSLQASVDELRARDTAPDTFGARAERILRMAEHEAHVRRERAESEAADIRELAHGEAERTIDQARAEAARVRADAERVRDDAERAAARARAALADARRDADLRVDTAAAMNEHVRGLRSAVRGELARLHAALGAELRALDVPEPVVDDDDGADGGPGDGARVEPVARAAAGPAAGAGDTAVDEDATADTSPGVVVSLPTQRDRPLPADPAPPPPAPPTGSPAAATAPTQPTAPPAGPPATPSAASLADRS